MADTLDDPLIRRYLRDLNRELGGFPGGSRREVIEEIREHIADATASGHADISAVLERLGTPAAIAADARERFGLAPVRSTPNDLVALVLLALSLTLVGYVCALVLIWRSAGWIRRDKLVATIVPGAAIALIFAQVAGHSIPLAVLVVALVALAPVYMAVRLRNKSRLLAAGVGVVAVVGCIPALLLGLLSLGTVAGSSSGASYSVVDGKHVCQSAQNNGPFHDVPCSSVPPPPGGWAMLESPPPMIFGYQYTLVDGVQGCATNAYGAITNVPCNTVPQPPQGWKAVATGVSSGCGPAPCLLVQISPPASFGCTPPPNSADGIQCNPTVPTYAPSPVPSNGR